MRDRDITADGGAWGGAADDPQSIAEAAARFGIWRMDLKSWTISWSSGVARIFGQDSTATGERDLDEHLGFYHPDDQPMVHARIAQAATRRSDAEMAIYSNRARIVRPNGDIREVMAQGVAEHGADGRAVALNGIVIDITETAQLERRAQETSDLLRTTLENMDQGLIMLGPDQRVRIHNRRVHELLGLSEELLHDGASFEDVRRVQHANGEFSNSPAEVQAWARSRELERVPTTHERHRPNGSVLEVRAVPLPDGGVVRTYTDMSARRAVENAVAESEQRYRLLAENSSDVIIWAGLDTIRRYVSPAAAAVLGYTPEELVGTKPVDGVHPDDAAGYRQVLDDLATGRVRKATTQQRYRHKDGRWIWMEVSFSLTFDGSSGEATGYVASLRDIADRKAVENALRLSEERLALVLESGSDGFWDWNITTGSVELSDHWYAMLGFEPGEFVADVNAWRRSIHGDDEARVLRELTAHLKGETPAFEFEYRLRNKHNDFIWVLARGRVVARDANGRATRMVGTHIDISRRKEAEQLIAHMAHHDALTGLPNRTLFRDRLGHEIGSATRHGTSFAVLACDLDQFKTVNDMLGHSAGDRLLSTIAGRLNAVVRAGDTVARLGGDEFAIILGQLGQPQEASVIAQRVIEATEQPIEIDGHAVCVGVSIGIAIGPGHGRDAEAIFKHADIALYRAKAAGRNTYRFFETGMDTLIAERNLLERDMREAIRHDGFTLVFQPVVNLAHDAVGGFEALLRWEHPTRGSISPVDFVPLAEETGLIVALGDWVLREACRVAASWPARVRVAVNVSAVQFMDPERLQGSVIRALAASGLAADRLELEITESVLIRDAEAVIACLRRLRALGVRVALDDFGTGYSSLSYLRRFPFNKIKIDRAFVRDIDDPTTAAIVRAVVGLAARVGADITAEGVETDAQLERVRAEGCTEMQGFLFSRPLPAAAAGRMLRRKRGQKAA